MNRNWMIVLIAAVFEVAWVMGLKHAETPNQWSGTGIAILVSMVLLIKASQKLPLGTTYAVFTGLGTAGTVVVEMAVFGEPFHIAKVLLILLLLGGVVGLKTVTPDKKTKGGA
ncbi:QacE family quaternary ammonium compound efflux SMR transporter [Tumebacillus algifaecis]|uniref:QacE family quaternary ammonium compound efflux SMR transporter n=1 Tax=Tumebacillus algifaecis TaxID=1214604 RepID=A0A223D6M2_9BACL|nr:multidrug efflux SMR transporter [Tumebacillus algifaecis]ASS77093.1 QacE family quaternary ammonium compound efflux SMR transporter [Tumebacillus algifaecis]